MRSGAECADCPFFTVCRGYFKWPQRDYDCTGVKTLLERPCGRRPTSSGGYRRRDSGQWSTTLINGDHISLILLSTNQCNAACDWNCDYLALCYGGCPVRTAPTAAELGMGDR
jgi:hypothetical protein